MRHMGRLAELIRGIGVLLSDVALICLMLMLIPLLAHFDFYIGYRTWLLYLVLLFLAAYGMMTAGANMAFYLAAMGIMIFAGTYFSCREAFELTSDSVDAHAMEEMLMGLGFGAAATGIHGAWMAYRLPGSNGILRYVDCLIVAFAFYLYTAYETGENGDQILIVISLAAVLLDLLAVNQLRTGEECPSVIQGAGTGGKLLLGLIFLLCLAAAGGIVGLASGQVHSLVDILLVILGVIWRVVSAILEGISMVLAYLILFLVALLPNAPPMAQERVAGIVQEGTDAVEETAGTLLPLWVWQLLLAAGLVAGIAALLYSLRNVKLKQIAVHVRKKKILRKSYFWESFYSLARRLGSWLWFRWNYLRFRKTPQGLFILAECTGRKIKLKRLQSESPGAYVRRLAKQPQSEQLPAEAAETGFSLEALAGILDQVFYGGKEIGLTAAEYDGYRKQIRGLEDKI